MAFYSELDEIINTVINNYILKNQNICKLLYYYPETYNLSYDPLIQPDIANTRALLLNNIFPLPKKPNAETDQKGFMTVVLTGGDFITGNSGYRKVNLVFDLVFHLNSWITQSSYRPYKIAEELDRIFNNQVIPELPIEGVPLSLPFRVKDYSSMYYGIQLIYELNLSSNIECFSKPNNVNLESKITTKPFFASNILNR